MWWKRRQQDFQAEIEAHLQLEADELRSEGLAPADAQAAARRAFGNRTAAQERFYESGRLMFWDHLLRDLRFAARVLKKDAVFSGLAILGLALGTGLSTAIFALTHALILNATAEIQDTGSYVGLARMVRGSGERLSYAEYRYYRDHAASFRAVDAYSGRDSFVLGLFSSGKPRAGAEDVDGRFASANFLSSKGLAPALGRSFTLEEEEDGASVVLLNFGFWKRRFAADPGILGKTVVLNAHPLTVIGIADARFGALDRTDLYLPVGLQPLLEGHQGGTYDALQLNVGARLRSGVTMRQALAEIDVLSMDLPQPATAGARNGGNAHTLLIEGGGSSPEKRKSAYATLFAIILAVSMILLIACSNLANLLLARAAVRSREIGVRLSLGASRGRLICQLLTESMLLAAAGGAFGLIFSLWLAQWLAHFLPNAPGLDLRPHPLVIVYAIALSVATGVSFGLAPALAASRTNLAQALHADALCGSTGSRRIWSPRNLLVIVPLAVSLMLLMGAGMTVRFVQRIYTGRPAFATAHLIGMWFRLDSQGYGEARTRQFQQNLRERIARIPGVTSVGLGGGIPFAMGWTGIIASNSVVSSERSSPSVSYNVVSSEFLATRGVPLIRGRAFTTSDRETAPPVAIVNRYLAQMYWPNEEAIGKRIRLAVAGSTWFDVIGVAQNLEDPTETLRAVAPLVYVPYEQGGLFLKGLRTAAPPYQMQFLIRTAGEPAGMKPELRQEVFAADSSLRVDIETIDELLEGRIGPLKTISLLLSGLGALALLMASVGIYAILAYAVSQRTREIGIRMALGAQRQEIVGLVMQRSLMLIAWGIGLGLAGVLVALRIVSSAVANFTRLDGPTFVSVALLLGLVAVLACYLPARKALRVDPMQALRWE